MNDPLLTLDPASVWAQIETQHQARAAIARDVLGANKTSLFDALTAVGITTVAVVFDGAGDSGQIESITARAGDIPTEVPVTDITIAAPLWDGSGVDHNTLSLSDAIEKLAYDFLEKTHDGWEINEGAFGEFIFDVIGQSIQLDYNERIETSEYSSHSW